jgi:hypothetical protein
MRKGLFLIPAAVLLATAAVAQDTPTVRDVTGAEDLVETRGVLGSTWVHPDVDMHRYDTLYLWEPEFQFREGGQTSSGTTARMLRGDGGPYAVRPQDQERFKKLVTETFVAELERSRLFGVADRVGPGTLIVRAGFVDITSFVPPNVTRRGNIHLAAVGEATIIFELIDAETGVIQARAGERRLIQPEARMRGVNAAPANSATVWADVERWARDRAQDLRKALEKAKKKASS